MKYNTFERLFSHERMDRYLQACSGDTRKAMTLYRYNLQLSQQMFTIICCFEVILRNAINDKLVCTLGGEWLKDSIMPGGRFCIPATQKDFSNISRAFNNLKEARQYTHSKLLASMDFGFWKYMFSPTQFRLTGSVLLGIFPKKERSTPQRQYNHSYIFNELDKINTMRNRIAHHEPICFYLQDATICTTHVLNEYQKIQKLFMWMNVDSQALLYGLDHVQQICNKINELKSIQRLNPPV